MTLIQRNAQQLREIAYKIPKEVKKINHKLET